MEDVSKWTQKQWDAAKTKWSKEKAKWDDYQKQAKQGEALVGKAGRLFMTA